MSAAPARRAGPRTALVLALVACQRGVEGDEPLGQAIEAGSPERVVAWETVGEAPLTLRLRAVNALGVPVASAPIEVEVDGVGVRVQLDGRGLGLVTLDTPGTHEVVLPDLEVVRAHATAAEWPGAGLRRADRCPSGRRARLLGDDRLVLADDGLWWCDAAGRTERVLTPGVDDPLVDVAVRDVDGDGLDDVVASTERAALLLRRTSSGLSWGTGLRAPGASLAGVDVADLDRDAVPDLVLVWRTGDGGVVDVMRGTGVLDYQLLQRIDLLAPPVDAALSWSGPSDGWELTVLEEDGGWTRYEQLEDRTFLLVSAEPPTALPDGARLRQPADLHGDGVEDVVVVTPTAPGTSTRAVVFDLAREPATFVVREQPGAWMELGDVDGDGVHELVTARGDGELRLLSLRERTVEFSVGRVARGGALAVQPAAPSAILHVDQGDHWQRVVGERAEEAPWRVAGQRFDNLLLDVAAAVPITPPDARLWWVTVQRAAGEVVVKRWAWERPGPVIESGRLDLGPGAVDDVAACGSELYVVVDGELVLVDLSGAPAEVARRAGPVAAVDCAEGARVALEGGDAVWLDPALVEVDRVGVDGARDLALVGEGLETCASEGCEVVAWGDAPGGPAAAVAEGDALTLRWPDHERVVPGGGALLVRDLDADGRDDLLALRADGTLWLHRATDTAVVPPSVWFLLRQPHRPWLVADADGDGAPELFATDAEGRLFVTLPPPEG